MTLQGRGLGYVPLAGSHRSLALEGRERSREPGSARFCPFMVSLQASGSSAINHELVFGIGPK